MPIRTASFETVGAVERALEHVRLRSEGGPVPLGFRVTLNFHPDAEVPGAKMIELLARDGLYRSQFETGTSNGGMTAYRGGARWDWESRIFGGAYDDCDGSSPSMRPKYGALNYRADPVGGSRRFGSCHLRLHHKVLGRTTFCYPDSHMQPEHFGVAERMALIDMAVENRRCLDLLDDYIEAHVHGPLRIDNDVEAVVLDPCFKGTHVEAVARQMPCAVEWHDGFRLPIDRTNDCKRYRGQAAADALSSMSMDGFVTSVQIGAARPAGMDYQLTKWAWHCVARFGFG